MISIKAYFMGRDTMYPPGVMVLANAYALLDRVSRLCERIGIELDDHDVASGYRPGHYNTDAHGAKKSAHLLGEAIDIKGPNADMLKKHITVELLDEFDLYMEDPQHTPTWVHLDKRPRRHRIFIP